MPIAAKVVIADLPSSDGENAASSIGAVFSPTDVTSETDVAAALDTLKMFADGEVNAVVNCAGVTSDLSPPFAWLRRCGTTAPCLPIFCPLVKAVLLTILGTHADTSGTHTRTTWGGAPIALWHRPGGIALCICV
jgi:NAD(P)-dependent dehydrogenase (short-subunit alcohol dehydrogenase family)